MQGFSLFSEPIIRLVDKLVGSTNAMRVDIVARTRGEEEEGGTEGGDDAEDGASGFGIVRGTRHRRVRVGGPPGGRSRGQRGGGGGGATTTKTMMTVEPGVWFRVEGEAGEDEYIEDGEGGCFRLRPWREFSIDVICIVIVFLCAFKGVRRVFEYNVKASRAESISSRCRRCHRHRCGTANSAGQVMS